MTTPALIPKPRAWLAVWPATQDEPPRLRCLAHDGPLPKDRAAKLKQAGGWEVDLAPAPLAEVYERFRLSPGWWDDDLALAEFSRVDQDPEYREQVRADIERRRAIADGGNDLGEKQRLLAAKGELVMFKGRAA